MTSESRRKTHVALGVHGRLLRADAGVGDLDDVLQLPGLLLDLRCQEQRRLGNDLRGEKPGGERRKVVNMASECWGRRNTHVSVEFGEGVDHIKAVHVHYGGVDDELGSGGDKS